MISNEVNCATAELRAIVMICTITIRLNSRVIILLSVVDVSTKWTNPLMAVLDPSDERINVCSAFFTPYDGVVFK